MQKRKITPEQAREIREAYANCESGQSIAERYGITRELVRQIWYGIAHRDSFDLEEAKQLQIRRFEHKLNHRALKVRKHSVSLERRFEMLVDQLHPIRVKRVPDWEEYAVSEDGRVWTLKMGDEPQEVRGHVIRSNGLRQVALRYNDKTYAPTVGRLVLSVFDPSPDPTLVVTHIDGNPSNDHLSNLRWAKPMSWIHEGGKHPRARISEDDVRQMRQRYDNGESIMQIAKDYGVIYQVVYCVVKRKTWKHVR